MQGKSVAALQSGSPENVLALVAALRTHGVEISLCGDGLHISAPSGAVTSEIRALLAQHKAEIVSALGRQQASPGAGLHFSPYFVPFAVGADGRPVVRCFRCNDQAWQQITSLANGWMCAVCLSRDASISERTFD
jgi:hypothetical protein